MTNEVLSLLGIAIFTAAGTIWGVCLQRRIQRIERKLGLDE